MDRFYFKYFKQYEILTHHFTEYSDKIWSVQIDQIYDMLYNFVASIKVYKSTFNQAKIELTLKFQCWNLDDRVLKDQDHRQVPNWEYVTQNITEAVDIPYGSQEMHMTYMFNKYKNYTQIIMNGNQIYFFNGLKSICNFDSKTQIFDPRTLYFPLDPNTQIFSAALNYKEFKDNDQIHNSFFIENSSIESIIIVCYCTLNKPKKDND